MAGVIFTCRCAAPFKSFAGLLDHFKHDCRLRPSFRPMRCSDRVRRMKRASYARLVAQRQAVAS